MFGEEEKKREGEEQNKSQESLQGGRVSQPVDPFDPMNLGISTDYAAAINARASTKPFELRKPNDQEYFRTSPLPTHRIQVGCIVDKQDMGKVYIAPNPLVPEIQNKYPKALRVMELRLAETLIGVAFVWPVPLAEDRGGKWNSSQRSACHEAESHWTNMAAGRGEYDVTIVDNPQTIDWTVFPVISDILRQAASDRLIDSLDHKLLRKLRGEAD
jgi:hypothetical protein